MHHMTKFNFALEAVSYEGRFDIRWLHLIQLNDYGRQRIKSISRQLNFFIAVPSLRFYKQCEHYFNIPTTLLLSQTFTIYLIAGFNSKATLR